MLLFPIKWRPLKFFEKLRSPLLTSNIVKGEGQFLVTECPWKIMKNTFYFILTNWISYWQIRFCTYYTFSLNQMPDIREVWKYWPLKDGFRSISQNLYRVAICGGWTKKFQTFNRHFFWERLSKHCIVELAAVFVCLLLSWSRRYSMKWSSNFNGP